jgi:hypothetical protein
MGHCFLRFIVQPLMGVIFAIREGRRDAREGRALFFRLFTRPKQGREVLLSSWKSLGKVLILALI